MNIKKIMTFSLPLLFISPNSDRISEKELRGQKKKVKQTNFFFQDINISLASVFAGGFFLKFFGKRFIQFSQVM